MITNRNADIMESFWNERYSGEDYAYGTEPNQWLARLLPTLPPGRILLPADGEGRNSVFAATLGWEAHACDLSSEGRRKAMMLAEKKKVSIEYTIGDFMMIDYPEAAFDAAALVYAHFDPGLRPALLAKTDRCLKPGGHVILEGFSRRHIEWQARHPGIGGPRDPRMLFTMEEINDAFGQYDILYLQEEAIELGEGTGHVGEGCVIRLFARKRGPA